VDLGLAGRSFIVTGGSRGLGFAVARELVSEGANVTVVSRAAEHVDAAIDALAAVGDGAAHGVVTDMTDDDAPTRIIGSALDTFGEVHGAFVSHGGPPSGSAADLDDDALRWSLELATMAPIRFTRDLATQLESGGAIVVLTSSSSVQPIADLAASNVARPAVWGYVKSLATELGPRGVRLNVLLPGRFGTERVAELEEDAARRTGSTPAQVRERYAQQIPLRRLGDPEELGRVAAFLLSPAASYVTGAAWAVDGGVIEGL
jgi:3-oxoacyl-[acyl-carrier protein] reductase